MRHTLELLICATIGGYCVLRCWEIMPLALAEAQAVIAAFWGRQRQIDAAIEEAGQ